MSNTQTVSLFLEGLRATDSKLNLSLNSLKEKQIAALIRGLAPCVDISGPTPDFSHVTQALQILIELIHNLLNFPTILSEIAQFECETHRRNIRNQLLRLNKCEDHLHDGEILVIWLQEYLDVDDWIIGLA